MDFSLVVQLLPVDVIHKIVSYLRESQLLTAEILQIFFVMVSIFIRFIPIQFLTDLIHLIRASQN